MSEHVTHRLDNSPYVRTPFTVASSLGPACGKTYGERYLYFSETPTCPKCRALPVMASAGANGVDANGSEVAHV